MNLKILFTQLKPILALKLLCFTAFNRLLNPYGNTFYGFSAEDQVINTLLQYRKDGYYVDVGCNHPIRFSNTFAFYLRGWRGLTIDANASHVALHKKIRPKDISICCAVSNSEKNVVFTRFVEDSISSISEEFVKECTNTPIVARELMVTRTLEGIFREHNVPFEFDFLAIDVEGHDFEVLSSISLGVYKPKLIVIEMINFKFENRYQNKICAYLEQNGYELVAYYHFNGFFLRNDMSVE